MIKKAILTGLVALPLLGAGIAIGAAAHDGWGHHHDTVVVSGTGTSAGGAGQTIVVSDGHGPPGFFFPFGLLFLALVLVLVVSAFRRRGRGGGGCGPGGPRRPDAQGGPVWLEEWHRRAHEPDRGAGPTGAASS